MITKFLKKLPSHWLVIIGLIAGVLVGFLLVNIPGGSTFALHWIKPFGNIFMNLLKLLAIPLIFTSLVKGITDLKDVTSLSRMGGKTFGWYVLTTIIAVTLGLIVVNIARPGRFVSAETRNALISQYSSSVDKSNLAGDNSFLHHIESMFPDNIFNALTSNANMLQIIVFTLLLSVSILLAPQEKTKIIRGFFADANDVVLQMITIILKVTPIGVFSLMVALITEAPAADIFLALGAYMLTVLLGLCILLFIIYPLIIKFIAKASPIKFLRGMAPAQLVAFTTSSAAATLPETMRCVRENLHIKEDVANFVVPIGATINMDGTTLYQAVAAIFIAQVTGMDLTIGDQLTVVLTASLAGFGSAAVPGAGILMLMIVLQSINIDPSAIALLFAVDRPLDMCRTTINVTGDAMIATIIDKKMKNTTSS